MVKTKKKQSVEELLKDVNVNPVETIEKPIEEKGKKDDYHLDVITDYYGKVDPFYLSEKDPEYAYRFLRADQKNLSMKTGNLLFQKGGWQVCEKDHLTRIGIKDSFIGPDGHYRVGDTILAFMPKKLFEDKEEYKIKKANEQVSAIKKLTEEGDPNVGGKEMHESMRGIETEKQLGM